MNRRELLKAIPALALTPVAQIAEVRRDKKYLVVVGSWASPQMLERMNEQAKMLKEREGIALIITNLDEGTKIYELET